MTQPIRSAEGHVTEMEMAAYVDRRLPATDRGRIEAHLAECAECRHEWLHVRRIARRATHPRRVLAAASLLAAAAVLVLMVRPGGEDPVRNGHPGQALVAYGPTGETALAGLRFVWGVEPRAVSYRLTLSLVDGAPVWTGSTADTTLMLPDSVALLPEQRYVWVADALLDDGSSRSTGIHEFRLVR